MFTKRHTDETKLKMSASGKGKRVGENNGMFGKRHADKSRLAMSEKKRGRKWVNKDGVSVLTRDGDDYKTKLEDGWMPGRKPLREKYVFIYNHDGRTRRIPLSQLMEYIATGDWFEGRR